MIDNDINSRLQEVRKQLAEWDVEGILIGSSDNRRWLSGFTGSAGWLLITQDKALLGTDSRYWEQARSQAQAFELIEFKGRLSEAIVRFVHSVDCSLLGLEAQHITLLQYEQLNSNDEISWVELKETIESLRSVKTPEEIEIIGKAAAITDTVMAEVNSIVKVGMTEAELAWELEKRLRENGANELAFPVIVASGPNGARAHHEPGTRKMREGDPLIVDMGGRLNGYCSDMTRTFYVGSEPDDRFQEIYGLVYESQETALKNMTVGMTGKEIDSLARDVIGSAGYGDAFGHSLGHGLGLAIHEDPRLSQLADESALTENMVVTVEPGIYLSGWGGVRIEDLVYFTQTGIKYLSKCPKNPIIPV